VRPAPKQQHRSGEREEQPPARLRARHSRDRNRETHVPGGLEEELAGVPGGCVRVPLGHLVVGEVHVHLRPDGEVGEELDAMSDRGRELERSRGLADAVRRDVQEAKRRGLRERVEVADLDLEVCRGARRSDAVDGSTK
jgi:hypothetical protein